MKIKKNFPFCTKFIDLSPENDLQKAAKNLFSSLYELQNKSKEKKGIIVAHLLPEKGLGLAINDRLYKASSFLCQPQTGNRKLV